MSRPEDVLYERIQQAIGYCAEEFDVGPMTIIGVLTHIMREVEIQRDDFINECMYGDFDLQEPPDETETPCP